VTHCDNPDRYLSEVEEQTRLAVQETSVPPLLAYEVEYSSVHPLSPFLSHSGSHPSLFLAFGHYISRIDRHCLDEDLLVGDVHGRLARDCVFFFGRKDLRGA